MTEHKYFKKTGYQSSGQLARYYHGGEYCPDAALVDEGWKPVFAKGHAFEAVVRDHATGSSTFYDEFLISEIENEPPDEIALAIHYGKNLDDLVALTQKGERSKTHSKRHSYIDECKKYPGKMPICQTDYTTMRFLAARLCELPFPRWHPFKKFNIGDFLSCCLWQQDHYWEENGVKKKELTDCEYTDRGMTVIADIKWTGSYTQFKQAFAAHHWIQALHYERGIVETLKTQCAPMLFLVGCSGNGKSEPALAQVWSADQRDRAKMEEKYDDLCRSFADWESAGKPKTGQLQERIQRVWL